MISVIIPTYKPKAYYFNDCINSVVNQTIDRFEYEVLIILNGPQEPYMGLILSAINKLSNIRLLYSPYPGVSSARNCGIEHSRGDYICFIDDDDLISPCYLEKLLLVSSNNTIGISNVYSFKITINELNDNFFICSRLRNKQKYMGTSIYRYRSFLAFPVAKMIHKEIISAHRFDCRFQNGEDALFITSLTDNFSKLRFTDDDAIYYVRERMGSASRRKIPLLMIFKNAIMLIFAYWTIYLKNPRKYSLMLFLSRIPGVLKNSYNLFKN